MSGFFSSLFGGANSTLDKNLNKFGSIGGFATGLGENDLSKSSNFFSSILSGDPAKIGQALAPEIAGIQGQKQQSLNSTAQFSNRSGGNNASNQMAGDTARGSVNNMVSSLLGQSASSLGSMGSGLLSQGMQAYNTQDSISQQQMQNWKTSILGSGISDVASTALNAGEGKIGL